MSWFRGLAGNLVRLFRKHEAHFRTDDRIDMDHVLTVNSSWTRIRIHHNVVLRSQQVCASSISD